MTNIERPMDRAPDNVPQALGRLRVALQDAYQRSSRELGLTAPQAELLCAALHPGAVGDIAAALRCDRSNVTRLLDRAAARGLVRRAGSDNDGRVTLIELSPEGRQLAERFVASLEAQLQQLLAGWSIDRRGEVVIELNEISGALDADRTAPHPRPRRRSSPRRAPTRG